MENLILTATPPPVDSPNRAPVACGLWRKCEDWTSGLCDHCHGPGGMYWLMEDPADDLPIVNLCPRCMKAENDHMNNA
jgi:hypothetical protein